MVGCNMAKRLESIIYTDGSNGIVRLPPHIWRAFYEAALYLDMDSVQETLVLFLERGGMLHKRTDTVQIVELTER